MITLIGATGFTGQLVARELQRLGTRVRLAGRDISKIERLRSEIDADFETARVDVTDERSLGAALKGAQVVISCAGPFTDVGEAVIRQAVHRGIHYVDTTGEQSFIKLVFERYGKPARDSGVALLPACAFEYALGDAAGALAAEGFETTDEIEIVYAVHGGASSRGTKKSIIRALGQPGFQLRKGKLDSIRTAAMNRTIDIPKLGPRRAYSFPGGEVLMLPKHVKVENITTFMFYPAPRIVVAVFALIGPALMRSPLSKWLFSRIDRGEPGPTEEERKRTTFTICCTAQAGKQRRRVTIEGSDPYGLTGVLAASVAHSLEQSTDSAGAVTASMVVGGSAFRAWTEAAGLRWTVEPI